MKAVAENLLRMLKENDPKQREQRDRYLSAAREARNIVAYQLAHMGLELDEALALINEVRHSQKRPDDDWDAETNPSYKDTYAYVLMAKATEYDGNINYENLEKARKLFADALATVNEKLKYKGEEIDENDLLGLEASATDITAHLAQAEDLLKH